MKKIIVLVMCSFLFGSYASAEDVYSPFRSVDLVVSGTTTARNQSRTYSGVSWFNVDNSSGSDVIDLSKTKPNLGIFSIQVYQINLAKSNASSTTLTSANSSGATYYLVYTISNKDLKSLWPGTGVTTICGPIQLSGSTTVVQTFPSGTPEFAKFMKVGVVTGMTQFETFKATLAIQ